MLTDLAVPALVSAVIAALVTLAIEYAAKPRLEARKEAILERARARRDVLRTVALAHSDWGTLERLLQTRVSAPQGRDYVQGEIRRLRERIQEHSADLMRLSPTVLDDANDDSQAYAVLTTLAGTLSIIGNGTAPPSRLLDVTEPAALVTGLLTERRRSRAGREFRDAADDWLKERAREGSDDR
jgi:hypothetical protein